MVRRLRSKVKPLVPVSFYPVLAPFYRWDRRKTILSLDELDSVFRRDHPSAVFPNAELRFNVAGGIDVSQFFEGGKRTAGDIESALRQAGGSMDNVSTVLDFGCGCAPPARSGPALAAHSLVRNGRG